MALQDLTMMLPSRLGCPLSLKTPNMGNTGTTMSVSIQYLRCIAGLVNCSLSPITSGLSRIVV